MRCLSVFLSFALFVFLLILTIPFISSPYNSSSSACLPLACQLRLAIIAATAAEHFPRSRRRLGMRSNLISCSGGILFGPRCPSYRSRQHFDDHARVFQTFCLFMKIWRRPRSHESRVVLTAHTLTPVILTSRNGHQRRRELDVNPLVL
jgi:hypothetical protein